MSNASEATPEIDGLEAEPAPARSTDDKVHRLARRAEIKDAPRAEAKDAAGMPATSELKADARERPAEPSHAPARHGSSRPKGSMRRPVMFAMLPVALVVGGYFYVTGGAVMSTDNAYVQADIVGVSNDISGIVSQVLVHDNQKVAKGDALFKLDDLQFRLALDRANAQLGSTRNDLVAMRTTYKDMQAQIEQAKADIALDQLNFDRQQSLVVNNYTAQATLDAARNTLLAAKQKLTSLTAQQAGIAANLNGDPDAPIENHPRYRDAVAMRDEAARQLAHTTVRAPFAGVVTNVPALQPGQYLAAAATAFNIVSSDHVWIEASPKETELTSVAPGQKATVEVDTYPGQQWTGMVESISPASASSFSLLPAENSSGNWVKVVQRIPMRVRVDNEPGKPPLRVGMSVELSVDTGHPRGLPSFITGLFGLSGA